MMKTKNNMLGLRLKELRKYKGLSQVAFGEAVNLSQQAIVGIETGKRETTVTRLVNIANFVDTTLDFLAGRSAIGFHDDMLYAIENSLLYDFVLGFNDDEAVNEPDFFHFAVHRSRIIDKSGCYFPLKDHYKRYSIAERLDILFCLWVLRDASAVLTEIDKKQSWRKVSSDKSMDDYFRNLSPKLEKNLGKYIALENPTTGKWRSDLGDGAPVYDHALYASDIVLRWLDTWRVAYNTLCAYGLNCNTDTQNQGDDKVELARKKKAEELAAKIEQLKKEAEKELNAEISQIQHDMPTKRRNKKTVN